MAESKTSRLINAPRARVYQALVDCRSLEAWLQPAGTRSTMHECDPQVGGHLRMEITHGPGPEGTRLFDLAFVELRPAEAVVFEGSFVSDDPGLAGTMRISLSLVDESGGTRITLRHEGLPDAISVEDNESGSASSLANLARLVERSA